MSTKKLNFTKAAIEAEPLPDSGRTTLQDAGGRESVPGLILRVTSAGARSFQVYKKINGKPVRVTLGKYPDLTIEQARRQAQITIAKLVTGTNPNVEKRVEKAKAVTLSEALENYLKSRPLKPTTVKDMRIAITHIAGDWLTIPLAKITPAMIQKRHKDFAETRSPARANLGMRYLRAVYNFAIARYLDDDQQPILTSNPVITLSRLKTWERVDRRRTYIAAHQLKPWFEAVQAFPGIDWSDYFQLVVLTGLRREEALSLKWEDVDFTGKTLTARDTKNHSDHTLPTPHYLLSLLQKRKADNDGRDSKRQSEYVFSDTTGKRISNPRYAQATITRLSGVAFTPHDLRRTFATIAESLDIPAYALKALLNHTTGQDVTGGYLVISTERLREPMQRISDFILKTAGVIPTAEVVQLDAIRMAQ